MQHDRLNLAAAAYLPVATEAQEALDDACDLTAAYQVDLSACRLDIGEHSWHVALLGTVSKNDGSWLWGWANSAFGPDHPCTAPTVRLQDYAEPWGLPQLAERGFDLDGLAAYEVGGPAGGLAFVATPLVGGTAWYTADAGTALAYLAIVDPRLPRPAPSAVTFPRRILSAVDEAPGHGRDQVTTYASVHGLAVEVDGRDLVVGCPDGRMRVEFDELDRIVAISGTLSADS